MLDSSCTTNYEHETSAWAVDKDSCIIRTSRFIIASTPYFILHSYNINHFCYQDNKSSEYPVHKLKHNNG